jgi:hypothetical protein
MEWSADDAQQFLQTYGDGIFADEAKKFSKLRGLELSNFSKEEFGDLASSRAIGFALFNTLEKFKSPKGTISFPFPLCTLALLLLCCSPFTLVHLSVSLTSFFVLFSLLSFPLIP